MKKFLMCGLCAVFVFLTTSTRADALYLHLPITEHFPGVEYETEETYGIGWTQEKPVVWGLQPIAGGYHNSHHATSLYIGLYHEWKVSNLVSYGVGGILLTGYDDMAPILPSPFVFVEVWRFRGYMLPGVVNLTVDIVRW